MKQSPNRQIPVPELLPPTDHGYTEAEVLALLRERVASLLESDRDWLLGKLYRLDVRERDLQRALARPSVDVAAALAELILARQRERLAARRRYPPRRADVDPELHW